MEKENKPDAPQASLVNAIENSSNPFENKLPANQEIKASQEVVNTEQEFKEAQTERD